jgi:hypothetical protein
MLDAVKPRHGLPVIPTRIVQQPRSQDKNRPLPNGHALVVVYEMMWLSEQLLRRGYRGAAWVKFVFAETQKDHKKWIWIWNLERWARDEIVKEEYEKDRNEGRRRWYRRWFGA